MNHRSSPLDESWTELPLEHRPAPGALLIVDMLPVRRLAVALSGVAALFLLVVLASRSGGELSTNVAPNEAAGDKITDAIAILVLLAGIAGAVLLGIVFWPVRRRKKGEDEFEPYVEQPHIHWAVKLVLLMLPLAIMAGLIYAAYHFRTNTTPIATLPQPPLSMQPVIATPGGAAGVAGSETVSTGSNWVMIVALGILGLFALAVAIWFVRRRNSSGASATEPISTPAASLAGELSAADEALDALQLEPDARKAVIAAYARMERTLERYGLKRHRAETPQEYAARVQRETDLGAGAVQGLTDLFELARFSHHAISGSMRDQAIAALLTIRSEV